MALRLVLFDLFGTLLDEASEYDALDGVMKAVVDRFELPDRPDRLSGEFSLALMEILRSEPESQEEPSDFVPYERAARDVFAAILEVRGLIASAEDKAWFWKTYLEMQRDAWRLFPEVRTALAELKEKGLSIGVVTDADRRTAMELFPVLHLDGKVDFVVCAEEVGFVKPHPAIFEAALQRGGALPAEAAMVGDSYERDILGARSAGIARGVLVDRFGVRDVEVPKVKTLKTIARLLDRLPDGSRN